MQRIFTEAWTGQGPSKGPAAATGDSHLPGLEDRGAGCPQNTKIAGALEGLVGWGQELSDKSGRKQGINTFPCLLPIVQNQSVARRKGSREM